MRDRFCKFSRCVWLRMRFWVSEGLIQLRVKASGALDKILAQ